MKQRFFFIVFVFLTEYSTYFSYFEAHSQVESTEKWLISSACEIFFTPRDGVMEDERET